MNINKYLAYLALCNSGTDRWENFNIDKSIVVKDFEIVSNSCITTFVICLISGMIGGMIS